MEMYGKTFDKILLLLENLKKPGAWFVLAVHEMGSPGNHSPRLNMLIKPIQFAQDPVNMIWIAPMGTVSKHIQDQRK